MVRESDPKGIAIISQYYFPDNASTGNLMTKLAEGLVKKGCDVRVYTGYPSYWGIKQECKKTEIINGVKIDRIFHLRTDTRTKLGSICHGLSFFIFTLTRLVLSSDNRLYLIVTTPPFLPFIGYVLKKIKGLHYIVIIHDIDPDISIKINFINEGLLTKIWNRCNLLMYMDAKRLIVLSECMAETIRQKLPKYPLQIDTIQNWEDGNFIRPIERNDNWFLKEQNLIEKFVILYSGNMGLNHNLETFLSAAKMITNANIHFLFIGEGAQKNNLIKKTEEMQLKNVTFLDFQPRQYLPYTMGCGDVILISQEKGTEGLCVSSKFYTALAAGKPIIALINDNSEIAKTILTNNCGFSIPSYDPKEIANRIRQLELDRDICRKFGNNSRRVFEERYTYEIAMEKYYMILNAKKCVEL